MQGTIVLSNTWNLIFIPTYTQIWEIGNFQYSLFVRYLDISKIEEKKETEFKHRILGEIYHFERTCVDETLDNKKEKRKKKRKERM